MPSHPGNVPERLTLGHEGWVPPECG
jgi:hypothetical protein